MLEFDVRWINVMPHLQSGQMPVYLLERPPLHDGPKAWSGPSEVARVGNYHVPQLDAFQDDPLWVVTLMGQHVRVPVHAYRTVSRSLAAIWGLGAQVGMAFLESFRSYCGTDVIRSVVLILGDDCTDLAYEGGNAFRAYVGVAIRSERQ